MPDMPVDLREDGTVRLALDKGAITLRRPLIGQLRDLHERLEQVNDDVRESLLALTPMPVRPVQGEGESDEAYGERRADYDTARQERRAAERKAIAGMDDLRVGWFREVCATLGDRPLPDVPSADLPMWAASTDVAVALVNHWQTVPLARGGK